MKSEIKVKVKNEYLQAILAVWMNNNAIDEDEQKEYIRQLNRLSTSLGFGKMVKNEE